MTNHNIKETLSKSKNWLKAKMRAIRPANSLRYHMMTPATTTSSIRVRPWRTTSMRKTLNRIWLLENSSWKSKNDTICNLELRDLDLSKKQKLLNSNRHFKIRLRKTRWSQRRVSLESVASSLIKTLKSSLKKWGPRFKDSRRKWK